MKNNEITYYLYRCRMCGEKYTSNTESGAGKEHENLVDAIHSIFINNQPPVSLTDIHKCKRNQFGIGDLIGCISR